MAPLGDSPGTSGSLETTAMTSSLRRRCRSRADANKKHEATSGGCTALAKKLKPGELSDKEIAPGMGDEQISMLRNKKIMEIQLALKLKDNIEQQDTLAGVLSRSMKRSAARDKVVDAAKGIDDAIKSTVFKDPEHRSRMYRVEVQMGLFTSGLSYRREGRVVQVEGSTNNGHNLLKEVKVEFPNTVDMNKLVVVCRGSKVEMRVPIRHWESLPCLFQAANLQSSSEQSDAENGTRESRTATKSAQARRRASSARLTRSRSRSRSRRKDSGNDTEDSQPENGFQDMASPDDSGFMSSDTESLPETTGLTELSLVDEWFKRNRLWNRFSWNI